MSNKSHPSLLMITGWAHGEEAMNPLADTLSSDFKVKILTGDQVLSDQIIPKVDYIVTGSMGGLLAIELLPESCKKLVLISSTARFCATTEYDCGTHERILKRMILQLKRNPDAVLEEFFKNVHFPHPAIKTDPGAEHGDLIAGLEYLLSADVRNIVPQINIPVLLLHGANDRIIPPGAAEWLHEHLPNNRLRIFENDGHALLAHHFNEAIEEIQNFL